MLREDLELGKPDNNLGDFYVAKIHANCMLAWWRDDIEKAVEEGNNCKEYSCILKPGPKTDAEKLALTLIEFFHPVCAEIVDLSQMENKETNKHCENTVQILNGTALGDGITLTYYSSSSDTEEEDSVKGTATKLQNTKPNQRKEANIEGEDDDDSDISWFVVLANGQRFEVVEDDLKNTEQYKVHLPTNNPYLSSMAENKKHKQQ